MGLDLGALLRAAGLEHRVVEEVTLTGLAPLASVQRRQWATNGTVLPEGAWRADHAPGADGGAAAGGGRGGAIGTAVVTMRPLEIRAWLLRMPAAV